MLLNHLNAINLSIFSGYGGMDVNGGEGYEGEGEDEPKWGRVGVGCVVSCQDLLFTEWKYSLVNCLCLYHYFENRCDTTSTGYEFKML